MIVGALPDSTRAAAITVNHFRHRAGSVICSMPYGRGRILFVGLPLLDPIAGEPDPLRDRMLSGLIESLAMEVRLGGPSAESTARPLALTDAQMAEYAEGMEHLTRLSALGDRYSFITSGRMAPAELALGAVVIRDRGLAGVFQEREDAWETLRSAFDGSWSEETAAFVNREESILEQLKEVISGATPEVRVEAAQVVQEWGYGVMAWIHGDHEEANARMDAADALLADVSSR